MLNLLNKEFRLAAHPTLYIFMVLGVLVIVPAYPYTVIFLFGCLAPYITMVNGRENHDTFYTALLPVRKRDAVKSKCFLFVMVQVVQLLISVPFAILRVYVSPGGNPVGIEANIAYYGFGFMIFSICNLVFLTQFYKTAYKAGKAFILAMIPVVLGILMIESLTYIPAMEWIDSIEPANLVLQLPILIVGIMMYVGFMVISYFVSAKRYEHVDL